MPIVVEAVSEAEYQQWLVSKKEEAAAAASVRPPMASPMADSTWSHGSVMPSSNHGMAPVGSCVRAT